MTCRSITISSKDHHDEITANIIKVSTLSIWEKKVLILAKCHDQELRELAMLEEVLIEFRNNFIILGIL
jgi:hypothetical protein